MFTSFFSFHQIITARIDAFFSKTNAFLITGNIVNVTISNDYINLHGDLWHTLKMESKIIRMTWSSEQQKETDTGSDNDFSYCVYSK